MSDRAHWITGLWGLVGLVSFGVVFFIGTVAFGGRLSLEDLRAEHATADSAFTSLGGIDIHLVEEGAGPLIVLVHGHKNSLRIWDAWADTLRSDYRVVRFDMPWYGLSAAGRSVKAGIVEWLSALGAAFPEKPYRTERSWRL